MEKAKKEGSSRSTVVKIVREGKKGKGELVRRVA